jgi:hypothetical protein
MMKHTPEFTQPQLPFDEIPYGYCHCGCGELAPVAKKTHRAESAIKGQPRRFIAGHNARIRTGLTNAMKLIDMLQRGKPDECWLWHRALDKRGYGKITTRGKTYAAHRVAYELEYGPIPEGLNVCHKCDTPACCNPAHLFVGTHADNVADKMAKGRQPRGERNGVSKLKDADVLEIRRQHKAGKTMYAIAKHFHVTSTMIKRIVSYQSWKHLP